MGRRLRIICLLLILCMVFPTSLISCDKKDTTDPPKDEPKEENISIFENGVSDFVIVRPENASDLALDSATTLWNAFNEKFGSAPEIIADNETDGEADAANAREILLGNTNREQSAAVYESIEKDTFVIKVVDNKLVIAADSDTMLENAIEYFVETHVEGASDKLELPLQYVYVGYLSDYGPVKLNEDGSATLRLKNFIIIFDKSVEQKFVPDMARAFGTRAAKIVPSASTVEDGVKNTYEIMFGKCERAEYTAYDGEFMFRDFFLYFKDNKLSVDAFSIYGYDCAVSYLCNALEKGKITIPAGGLYVKYEYEDSQFGNVLRNYENQTMEGAWMVNMCHRGNVTTGLPENSIPAYQSCIDNGIDIIETDLKRTSDPVWVVCHDQSVNRTTNGNGLVSSLPLKKLKNFYLLSKNGGTGAKKTEYRIPTLEEIILLGKGYVIYNLDAVSFENFQSVYDVFESHSAEQMAMFKGSADAKSIARWFASLTAEGRTLPLYSPLCYSNTASLLRTTLSDFKGLSSLIEMKFSGATDDQLKEITAYAVSVNIRPLRMTIYEEEVAATWEKLASNGYNSFMTDQPIRLKEFIHGK